MKDPRATQFIQQMISIIEELMENGSAYEIEGSGIYFDTSKFDGYGALVNRSVEELRDSAKARIDADEEKDDPLDFALWKTAKPGEPTWDSPLGTRKARLAHRMCGNVFKSSRRGL